MKKRYVHSMLTRSKMVIGLIPVFIKLSFLRVQVKDVVKKMSGFNALGMHFTVCVCLCIISTVNVLKLRTLKNNYFFRCS